MLETRLVFYKCSPNCDRVASCSWKATHRIRGSFSRIFKPLSHSRPNSVALFKRKHQLAQASPIHRPPVRAMPPRLDNDPVERNDSPRRDPSARLDLPADTEYLAPRNQPRQG